MKAVIFLCGQFDRLDTIELKFCWKLRTPIFNSSSQGEFVMVCQSLQIKAIWCWAFIQVPLALVNRCLFYACSIFKLMWSSAPGIHDCLILRLFILLKTWPKAESIQTFGKNNTLKIHCKRGSQDWVRVRVRVRVILRVRVVFASIKPCILLVIVCLRFWFELSSFSIYDCHHVHLFSQEVSPLPLYYII